METVYVREGFEKETKTSRDRETFEIADLRNKYRNTHMSAHQIKEMMDFASQTLEYSSSVGTATPTSQKIKALHDDISLLCNRTRELDRAVEIANRSPLPPLQPLRQSVEAYIGYVRHDAIPSVRNLYEAIVASSNERHDEGRRELARSKRNAAHAASAALVLYALGSLLALGGQYLDKVHKKRLEASAATPIVPAYSPTSSPR